MQLSLTHQINGSDYSIIINTEPQTKATGPPPLQIYVSRKVEVPSFGGYVYSLPRNNQVIQSIIKNGNNIERCKSFGNLICTKFGVCYVNLNDIDEFDYYVIIKEVIDMINESKK